MQDLSEDFGVEDGKSTVPIERVPSPPCIASWLPAMVALGSAMWIGLFVLAFR